MFVNARELVGALKAARMFACEDIARTSIHGVYVEAVGSALRFISTDGHTMWACETPARDSAGDPAPAYQTPWLMPLAVVDSLIKRLKGWDEEVVIMLAKRTVQGVEYAESSGTYAPYRVVVPALQPQDDKRVLPEFAAMYVARCCEALGVYSLGFAPELLKVGSKHDKKAAREARNGYLSPPIAWRVGGELDPAIFYSPQVPRRVCDRHALRGQRQQQRVGASFVERLRSGERTKAA